MLDAITEHACLTLAVFSCVLLRTKYDGFAAILAIDAVNDLVQPLQLLIAHRVVVQQIGLNGILRTEPHDQYACTLVLKALEKLKARNFTYNK